MNVVFGNPQTAILDTLKNIPVGIFFRLQRVAITSSCWCWARGYYYPEDIPQADLLIGCLADRRGLQRLFDRKCRASEYPGLECCLWKSAGRDFRHSEEHPSWDILQSSESGSEGIPQAVGSSDRLPGRSSRPRWSSLQRLFGTLLNMVFQKWAQAEVVYAFVPRLLN